MATDDVFWDQHNFLSNVSVLNWSGKPSCQVVCTQTYLCNGKPVGNSFTITFNLTKGTVNGYAVSLVGVTKK